MKKLNYLVAICLICSVVILQDSCRKKTEVDSETTTSRDNAIGDQSFSKINSVIVGVSIKEEGVNKTGVSNITCATVTVTPIDSTYPKTLTIDYGSGCTESDGHVYRGVITAQISGKWANSGTVIDYIFTNFSIGPVSITGTGRITNNGNNSYSTRISSGSCSFSGVNVNYESEKTITWVSGMNTDTIPDDDVYDIIGSSVGVGREGKSFASVILQPIRIAKNCKWITQGQVSLTPSGGVTRNINYGKGLCDRNLTVTIDGTDYDILLDE